MSPEHIERFTAGEAFVVDPDAIERELASVWREAGQASDAGAPVTRACLLNVIAVLEERDGREGFGQAATLQGWIDELPRHLAARSLVVRSRPATREGPDLQSWISANCIIAEGGGKLVCSEEVTLAAKGNGDHHVPGLVRALLVPGLPTSVVVSGVPRGPLAEPLLAVADRAITNVDASANPAPLRALVPRTPTATRSGMDVGWIGTAALRDAVASPFDPPFDPAKLAGITAIRCGTPSASQWSSRLVLGWLAGGLGARAPEVAGGPLPRPGAEPLQVTVAVDDSLPGPSFAFEAGGWSAHVRCLGSHIEVEGPGLPVSRRPRQELGGAAALARALVSHSEDASFRRALRLAEHL